jgi:hypothetical protein
MLYQVDHFALAKERSLTAFLEQALQSTARGRGRKQRMDICPNCGASHVGSQKLEIVDDRYYACFGCGDNGSIIDAAMRLYSGLSTPLEAAKYVLDGNVTPALTHAEIAEQRKRDHLKHTLQAQCVQRMFEATRDKFDMGVYNYLRTQRCITPDVINWAWQQGLIGSMPSDRELATQWLLANVGEALLRQSGLWKEDHDRPWIAGRPFVQFFDSHKYAELRILYKPQPGSTTKKTLAIGLPDAPFWMQGEDSTRCLVAEAVLECLAARSMGYKGSAICASGTGSMNPDWLKGLYSSNGIKVFDLAFNNDHDPSNPEHNPGQAAQSELGKKLNAMGIPWADASPHESGDINDALIRATRKKC